MEERGKEIKIKLEGDYFGSSLHTLDLRKRIEPRRKFLPKIKKPSVREFANNLLIFSLTRTVLKIFFSFPALIARLARNSMPFFRRIRKFSGKICLLPIYFFHKASAAFKRRGIKFKKPDSRPNFSFNWRRLTQFEFSPPQYLAKALGVFVILSLVLALPFKALSSFEILQKQKDKILSDGLKGYEELKTKDFSGASASFASAKKTIDDLNFFLYNAISLIPGIGQKLNMGKGLLVFGRNFSEAADLLQEGLKYFDKDVVLANKIKYLEAKIGEAVPHLLIGAQVLDALGDKYSGLPIDLKTVKSAASDSAKALLVFQEFSETLLKAIGDDHFKRYLIIFQNNNEIRPTGGFIGSFAVVDVDRGEIKQIDIPGGGSYDVQGQLKEFVISPEPFHLINSAWQFQDSNWFPDFPSAAKKIMWFYEKSGGPSVDGVVAINASLMEELLKIIGPIEMSEYGRTMTAENFIEETQKIVELEYDKTDNKPKQMIADMTPKVLDKLFKVDAKTIPQFAGLLHKAILDKDLQVYAKDEELESGLASFGVTGELKDVKDLTDYLMLIDTNIAGQKTDGKIIKEIKHVSEIAEDGTVTNTVYITRKHTGVKGALFSGVRNVNYLRLYVPEGSELLDASGFKAPSGDLFKSIKDGYSYDKDLQKIEGPIYIDPSSGTRINNEFDRTVFGNWIMVDPGQEATVSFKYKLPKKFLISEEKTTWAGAAKSFAGFSKQFLKYKMLIEKQAGAKNTNFKSYVAIKGKEPAASVGNNVALQRNAWQFETDLDSNKYYGVVVKN